VANPKYHPIPSAHPRSKPLKRTAASRLDWNQPKRQNRTPRAEYGFMRDYALLCGGVHPGRPTGGGR
jgi:hypothetical protein